MIKHKDQIVADLHCIVRTAVDSVVPSAKLAAYLPHPPKGRCVVVGAGKASAKMAAVINELWANVELTGVVSTRYAHGVDAGRIDVIEAGHPIPDINSTIAAQRMLDAVHGLTEDDLVLALISGGGSASCSMPIDGLSLAEKQFLTQTFLQAGASISEVNCVRKALSKIKGGGLALAALPAKVHSLIISDIPGDNAYDVASGPTLISPQQDKVAIDLLRKYGIGREIIPLIKAKPSVSFSRVDEHITFDIVATPMMALRVAAESARALGYTPIILSDEIEGESTDVGKVIAAIAKSINKHQLPIKPPAAIISGGETSVTIGHTKAGKGGRNTNFLLSFAIEAIHEHNIYALAVDSDGIDGTEDAAGAIFTPDTPSKAIEKGLILSDYLASFDSYTFFELLDDLIITGPTFTNVNDIRVVLVV